MSAGWSAISSSKKSLVSDEKEPDLEILHGIIGDIESRLMLFADSVRVNSTNDNKFNFKVESSTKYFDIVKYSF